MWLRLVRNRISTIVVMYSLYLYFLGLSKNVSKVLIILEMRREAKCMSGTGFRDLESI